MDVEVRPPEAFVWREAIALPWSADPDALRAVEGIGRTEDVHLSPDNRRLALAYPHGAFWIDEQILMVANRQGDAPLLRIPEPSPAAAHLSLEPVACQRVGGAETAVHTPGSVSVVPLPGGLLDVLLCNHDAHHVSRWLIDARNGHRPLASARLLARGLRISDGVAQSRERRWIAVSNHDDHSVYVHDDAQALGPDSPPDAVLRGLNHPHGLRWTADAQARVEHERVLAAQGEAPALKASRGGALSDAERLADDRMTEIEALRRTVDSHQRRIERVAGSGCWRVTAPHRWLRRRLSALAARSPHGGN